MLETSQTHFEEPTTPGKQNVHAIPHSINTKASVKRSGKNFKHFRNRRIMLERRMRRNRRFRRNLQRFIN
jgi:hypothetical protein